MNLSAADRCAFVGNTRDCGMVDGFISYLRLVFCLLPPYLSPLTVTLCVSLGRWGSVGVGPTGVVVQELTGDNRR